MALVVLSIAGSDPSGGAGIQADLKTFQTHGVFGQAVVSLLTVQNTLGVQRVLPIEPNLVREQIAAVLDDSPPEAVKIGAIAHPETAQLIAELVAPRSVPVVVDPVLGSSSGAGFGGEQMVCALADYLVPVATVLTPNLEEASRLTGLQVEDLEGAKAAALRLVEMGSAHALVTGGHLAGEPVDALASADGIVLMHGTRVETRDTHGTGCAYSSAIAARLARGEEVATAVRGAKRWLEAALRNAPGVGQGHGPLGLDTRPDL